MALITRCPVCGTRFKVVPDQLRISDGWVRCGECGEVFDASAELSQGEIPPSRPPLDAPGDTAPPPFRPSEPWRPEDPVEPEPPEQAHSHGPAERFDRFEPADPRDGGTGRGLMPVLSAPPAPRDSLPGAPSTPSSAYVPYVLRAPDLGQVHAQDSVHAPDAPDAPDVVQSADASGQWADPAISRSADASGGNEAADGWPQGPVSAPERDPSDDANLPVLHQGEPAQSQDGADAADAEAPVEAATPVDAPIAPVSTADDDAVPQSLTEFPADMSTLPEDLVYVAPPPPAEVEAALDERTVSFLNTPVAAAPRAAVWQRPWMRRGLIASAGLLGLLLAAQAAVQQRDQIAAWMPAAKPALQALCAPLRCTVEPLRQIESIVIDSSTFTTVRHGVYRLNVVLKNRAPTEIAVPSIELALTDTQEQAVLRRVLQPSDMVGGAPGNIAGHAEWTAAMELSVTDEASIGRIVGYRLLAFYP